MSLATERNSEYIDKVFLQAWTLQKLKKIMLFLKFALFNQGSETFLV